MNCCVYDLPTVCGSTPTNTIVSGSFISTSPQAFTSGIGNTILFPTTLSSNLITKTNNDTFTIPVNGYYTISYAINAGTNGNSRATLGLMFNDVSCPNSNILIPPSGQINNTITLYLPANTTIKVIVDDVTTAFSLTNTGITASINIVKL